MFPAARWKAYLQSLQDNEKNNADGHYKTIYHIFHSQKIWFTRDDPDDHLKVAEEHLKQCNVLLEESSTMLDELEDTLARTPKPSEVLDWSTIW